MLSLVNRLLEFSNESDCTEFDFECMYPSIIFKGINNIETEFLRKYKEKDVEGKQVLYKACNMYNKESRINACNNEYCCRRLREEYLKNFPPHVTSTKELGSVARIYQHKLICELALQIVKHFPHIKLYDDVVIFADQLCFNNVTVSREDTEKVYKILQNHLHKHYPSMFNLRHKNSDHTFKSRQKMMNFSEKHPKNLEKIIINENPF